MKGKQLSVEDLKVLPWGTKITWGLCTKPRPFAGVNKNLWYAGSGLILSAHSLIDDSVYLWVEEPEKMGLYGVKDIGHKSYSVQWGKKSELEKDWQEIIEINLK